jgi:hypothetical protein
MDLGQRMTRAQISFTLADHEVLAGARVSGDRLGVNDLRFSAVVLPAEVELPSGAAATLGRFEANGGQVLRDATGAKVGLAPLAQAYKTGILNERADRLVVGRFTRAGRELIMVVNVGTAACERAISAPNAAKWLVADPGAGTIEPVGTHEQSRIPVSLPGRATRVFIGPQSGGDERTRTEPSAS